MWASAKPMNCSELLYEQVNQVKAINPNKRVFVYRNSIKALPWYTSVRLTLSDPAYSPWFLNFTAGNVHVPRCDTNYQPPLCSNYYHDQSQTPEYPQGDGNCAAPGCDVGPIPVGEYLWDPRAANISVYNQTLLDWLINSYIFDNTGGGSDLIDGFFFDDLWSVAGPSEFEAHAVEDMGLTKQDLIEITEAYYANMKIIEQTVIDRGKFSWQMLYTDGATCPRPLVTNTTCSQALRSQCTPNSLAQTSAMMYAFSPGGCECQTNNLYDLQQDLANFLLIRGDYGWLGHGWCGCSIEYSNPPELTYDYGTPLGLCNETQPNSGIFVRQYTKATVQMDCNTWTGTINMKE